MAQEDLAIVELLLEKFKAGDLDVFDYYDPEIEWDARRGTALVPEIAHLYHGHEGVRAYWREWLTAWEPIDTWDYELRDGGGSVVVVISGQRQRGRRSGVEVGLPPYALVFTLRARKVVRWEFYADPGEALEAAGIAD